MIEFPPPMLEHFCPLFMFFCTDRVFLCPEMISFCPESRPQPLFFTPPCHTPFGDMYVNKTHTHTHTNPKTLLFTTFPPPFTHPALTCPPTQAIPLTPPAPPPPCRSCCCSTALAAAISAPSDLHSAPRYIIFGPDALFYCPDALLFCPNTPFLPRNTFTLPRNSLKDMGRNLLTAVLNFGFFNGPLHSSFRNIGADEIFITRWSGCIVHS